MKDSHEWTDLPSSVSFTVEGHGKVTYDTGGAGPTINRVPGDWMLFPLRAVMDEILRLAGRVEEMETREQRSWTGLQMRRLEEREAEIALLRRERELLIVLEKERACVLDSVLNRGQVRASQLDRLADIMVAIQALHQEARGGVLLPEGVPCRCLLCRPATVDGALAVGEEIGQADAEPVEVAVYGGGTDCPDGAPHRRAVAVTPRQCIRCGSLLRTP